MWIFICIVKHCILTSVQFYKKHLLAFIRSIVNIDKGSTHNQTVLFVKYILRHLARSIKHLQSEKRRGNLKICCSCECYNDLQSLLKCLSNWWFKWRFSMNDERREIVYFRVEKG